jgi:hypothetical protein
VIKYCLLQNLGLKFAIEFDTIVFDDSKRYQVLTRTCIWFISQFQMQNMQLLYFE